MFFIPDRGRAGLREPHSWTNRIHVQHCAPLRRSAVAWRACGGCYIPVEIIEEGVSRRLFDCFLLWFSGSLFQGPFLYDVYQ